MITCARTVLSSRAFAHKQTQTLVSLLSALSLDSTFLIVLSALSVEGQFHIFLRAHLSQVYDNCNIASITTKQSRASRWRGTKVT